jgi:hypothetical protein
MNTRSIVDQRRLWVTEDIEEARRMAFITVNQAIELCNVSLRTWYRWKRTKAPKWAVRLILSQTGDLSHLGWTHWEIRGGVLYCNELSARYHWEPHHLILPLYGIDGRLQDYQKATDNLSQVVPINLPQSTQKRA